MKFNTRQFYNRIFTKQRKSHALAKLSAVEGIEQFDTLSMSYPQVQKCML